MIDLADRILRDLIRGDFRLTYHAEMRMSERRVRYEDIRFCAYTAKACEDQGEGRFFVIGLDLDGDVLKVIATWDGETVVITLLGD